MKIYEALNLSIFIYWLLYPDTHSTDGVTVGHFSPSRVESGTDHPLKLPTVNGFVAGLFTYFLTEYLWRETATPNSAIDRIRPKIPTFLGQTPQVEVAHPDDATQPLYFLNYSHSE